METPGFSGVFSSLIPIHLFVLLTMDPTLDCLIQHGHPEFMAWYHSPSFASPSNLPFETLLALVKSVYRLLRCPIDSLDEFSILLTKYPPSLNTYRVHGRFFRPICRTLFHMRGLDTVEHHVWIRTMTGELFPVTYRPKYGVDSLVEAVRAHDQEHCPEIHPTTLHYVFTDVDNPPEDMQPMKHLTRLPRPDAYLWEDTSTKEIVVMTADLECMHADRPAAPLTLAVLFDLDGESESGGNEDTDGNFYQFYQIRMDLCTPELTYDIAIYRVTMDTPVNQCQIAQACEYRGTVDDLEACAPAHLDHPDFHEDSERQAMCRSLRQYYDMHRSSSAATSL